MSEEEIQQGARLVLVAAQIRDELKRIADRLEAWDTVYRTQATQETPSREIHSLRETSTVFQRG